MRFICPHPWQSQTNFFTHLITINEEENCGIVPNFKSFRVFFNKKFQNPKILVLEKKKTFVLKISILMVHSLLTKLTHLTTRSNQLLLLLIFSIGFHKNCGEYGAKKKNKKRGNHGDMRTSTWHGSFSRLGVPKVPFSKKKKPRF